MGALNSVHKIKGRINYNTKQYYREFIKKYPKMEISYHEYINIIEQSNLLIHDNILDNPMGFKLPYTFGYVAVDKYMPTTRRPPVDWINSIKFKKRIPRINLHSFGYMFKIKLFKNPISRPLIVYNMKALRNINRNLAKHIFAGDRQYVEIDPTYFSQRFRIDKIIKNPINE